MFCRYIFYIISMMFLAWADMPIAYAAGFDCADAGKPDEIAICSSPVLSELDTRMDALWFSYSKIPLGGDANEEREAEAEAFLHQRNECGADETCLRTLYKERISALEREIADWMENRATGEDAWQVWSSRELPEAIWQIVQSYRDNCTQLGGTLAKGFDQPLVMTADLDGDRVQDFLLNPQNMQCSAAATAYCGNGGCDIRIALSSNAYDEPVEILGGAPTLKHSEAGTFLDVWVDSNHCENLPEEGNACLARFGWKDGELLLTYAKRNYED